MRGVCLTSLAFLFALIAAAPLNAAPKERLDFKNNVMPGNWTRHVIVRDTVRTRKLPDRPGTKTKIAEVEKLEFEQKAEWTQVNIDDPAPSSVLIYQQMADDPARVVSMTRRGEVIKPKPKPEELNLSKGSTKLLSAKRTLRDSPVQTPLLDQPDQCILELVLDFVHWPAKRIDVGHKWERDISLPTFEGKQQFEFVDFAKVGDETVARVTMYVKGKFKGMLDRKFEFEKIQAIIYWSRMNQSMRQVEAKVSYRRLIDDAEYTVKIDVALEKSGMLNDKDQEEVKSQVGIINAALKEVGFGHVRETSKIIADFRHQWPGAMMGPAVDELERRLVDVQRSQGPRLTEEQLQGALTAAFIQNEAGRAQADVDLIEASRRVLTTLATEYYSKLKKWLKSEDEKIRSISAVTIGLAARPDALRQTYVACHDNSEKVRLMAMTGLLLRGGNDIDPKTLLAGMADKSAGVRQRSCETIAACIARENVAVDSLIQKLDKLMVHDEKDVVRLAAIRAIVAIGGPPDVSKLQTALMHEMNKSNRAALERGIERLQSSGG